MADDTKTEIRAKGFAHVETALIPDSVHYLLEDQPGAVSELIERHGSLNAD